MFSTDPVSDMFTRIRNAIAVNKPVVDLPHSKLKETVAKILVSSGFLRDTKTTQEGSRRTLQIIISDAERGSTITEISRLSTPGRRIYVKADKIPVVKRGRGIVIVSTSQGIMTGQEARTKKLGGELIGKVY